MLVARNNGACGSDAKNRQRPHRSSARLATIVKFRINETLRIGAVGKPHLPGEGSVSLFLGFTIIKKMRNILAVCTKELYTYFVSPIAYFVCFVFTAISGFLFSILIISASNVGGTGGYVMETLFGNMAIVLLFFTPVLTMKLFAEERKSGTIELLLTSPITDGQVVLGKFLASCTLVLIMLGLTLLFPLLTQRFGYLDSGLLISGYLGIILISASFLSLGLLMSSMCKNQLVAALTSFGILITLWVIGSLAARGGPIAKFLSYLSLPEHYRDFSRGIILLKDVIFYISFTCVCLFATFKSIESSKWR